MLKGTCRFSIRSLSDEMDWVFLFFMLQTVPCVDFSSRNEQWVWEDGRTFILFHRQISSNICNEYLVFIRKHVYFSNMNVIFEIGVLLILKITKYINFDFSTCNTHFWHIFELIG